MHDIFLKLHDSNIGTFKPKGNSMSPKIKSGQEV